MTVPRNPDRDPSLDPDPHHEAGPEDSPGGTLLDLLELEIVEENLFRANFVFSDPFNLYGGQVAAQALRAAGLTVPPDRVPHSLHGYFLRAGDASRPTVFQVFRDRDGRSYSARRVVAVQRGEVIFNMSVSFQAGDPRLADQPDEQGPELPDTGGPDANPSWTVPRLFSFEGRLPEQPYPHSPFATRFWSRCTQTTDDPLINACVLVYLSDISSGLGRFDTPNFASGSSLDHAVWFHRPAQSGEWLLMDMVGHSVAAGRGWYTGSILTERGSLVASFAQEALFRHSQNNPFTRNRRPIGDRRADAVEADTSVGD
jgi:acyl-CoA thioesterase-2